MEKQTRKDIELPPRLCKEDAELISKMLTNYEWFLAHTTPATKVERLFMELDKERLKFLRRGLLKEERK